MGDVDRTNGQTVREWILENLSAGLVSAFLVGLPLVWYGGGYVRAFNDHLLAPSHPAQLAQNAATTRAINEVDTKVEIVQERVDATNRKIDEQAKESAQFRAEQRQNNEATLRALSRIEGKLGGTQ